MIELEEVRKEYGGWIARARGRVVQALDGISLHVAPGTALGIVGPNGAGKSTLIRLLLGYLGPSRGALRVAGMEPRAYVAARGVGYVPETAAIPPSWTGEHALSFYAALGDVEEAADEIARVLGRVGLGEVRGRRIAALSKGMLQRVALAQALLGNRVLMVLDEPTTGLDPEWIAELRAIVGEW